MSYQYNQSGLLTEITNPWNVKVGYTYNHAGEMTGVTGQNYAGVTSYASGMVYRAFGGLKQMNYNNGRSLSLNYNNRMFLTQWSVPGVLPMQYQYEGGNGGRVEFARNQGDETLDRYFAYDHVGRLIVSRSGNEARLAIGEQVPLLYNGPYSHGYQYDKWGNMTFREGWGGANPSFTATYTNNKRDGVMYDPAGNLTNDGQNYTYDATGQQATASYSGYSLQQMYDGDRLRVKKVENGTPTYYLRSTVLGGQVVAELNSSGSMTRGFVYQGGQLLATQQNNQVSWVHEDPVVKSKRVTNSSGNVVSTIELDPWGGDTNRSSNEAFQPRRFTSYDRDLNNSDEAMHRRYNRWHSRFDQPDPYDGSYNMSDPQSFNRYSYVHNDPVNFVDPLGLDPQDPPQDPNQPPPTTHIDPATGEPYAVPGVNAGVVTINMSGGERSASVGGTSSGPMEIELPSPTNGPTGAEIVPQATIQANPDSECLTINILLGDTRVREVFDSAWRASASSGNENGGWLFADENYPKDVFLYKASEGTPRAMDKEPEEFKDLLKKMPTSRPRRFILDYHTHTNQNPSPGSDIWVRDTRLKRGSIGVIVYGTGKYTFYNDYKIIPPSEYNNCL